MDIALYLVVGALWASLIEYLVHRYILHWVSRKWGVFRFHLHGHHRYAVEQSGRDHDYDDPIWRSKPRMKELLGLFVLVLIHAPMHLISGWLYLPMVVWPVLYYILHLRCHRYPGWGWRWLPWHMEHHMVKASRNFGVLVPFWDWALGTLITRRP